MTYIDVPQTTVDNATATVDPIQETANRHNYLSKQIATARREISQLRGILNNYDPSTAQYKKAKSQLADAVKYLRQVQAEDAPLAKQMDKWTASQRAKAGDAAKSEQRAVRQSERQREVSKAQSELDAARANMERLKRKAKDQQWSKSTTEDVLAKAQKRIEAAGLALKKVTGESIGAKSDAATMLTDGAPSGVPDGIKPRVTDASKSVKPSPLKPKSGNKVANGSVDPEQAKIDKINAQDKLRWINNLKATFSSLSPADKADVMRIINNGYTAGWDASKIANAITTQTRWGKETLPSLQQFFILSHDPTKKGLFEQTMKNQEASVETTLELLGVNTDKATHAALVSGWALEKEKLGMSDDQFAHFLAGKVSDGTLNFTGGGQVGTYLTQLQSLAQQNGLTLDPAMRSQISVSLLDPQDGKDSTWWENNLRQMAAERYPVFADGLKSGRSLYDLTYAYRTQMASLLELNPETIPWDGADGLMSRVTTNVPGSNGVASQGAATLTDFANTVRHDPRWQFTQNARDTYENQTMDILRRFGMVG